MKIKSPIILLSLIVLLAGLFMPYTTVYADGEDEFEVKVNVEEDPDTDCYDVGIEVYNKGKDFTGSVEVTQGHGNYYDQGTSTYLQDASLPQNNTKTVSFQIPEEKTSYSTSSSSLGLTVVIRDSKNRKVYEKSFNNVLTKEGYRMDVALLSDSADKLAFMDCEGDDVWISTGLYSVKLNELKADNIVSELVNNKFLVINNYDTSVLSDEAVKTIESWVNNGGVLIIGTGDSMKTLSGFSSDFTGIKGSQGQGDGSLSTQIVNDPFQMKVQYLENDYNNSNDFFVSGYGQIGYTRLYGNGSVNTLSFNLEDLENQQQLNADEQEKKDEVKNIVSQLYDNARGNTNFVMDQPDINLDGNNLRNASHYMEKPANTRMGLMIPIILVYIVIIGPILYLILKKYNKREKCWIIIPGVALLFTVILFVFSISFSVKGIKLKTITMQAAGSDNVISLVEGYSANADVWTAKLDSKYYTGYNLYSWSASGTKTTFMKTADGLNVSYKPSSVFDEATYAVYGKTNRTGFFDIGGEPDTTIVNNTGQDFDYVIAYDYGAAYVMKDCKNGEKVSVSQHVRVVNSSSDFSSVMYQEYSNGNYDVASDYAAMQVIYNTVCDSGNVSTSAPIIIGVRKSENILNCKDGEEVSYTCVYMK